MTQEPHAQFASVQVHQGGDCSCPARIRHVRISEGELTRVFAVFLDPRPGDQCLGMTKLGVQRDEYNASVEGRPPRFRMVGDEAQSNPAYFEWALRADTWARAVYS